MKAGINTYRSYATDPRTNRRYPITVGAWESNNKYLKPHQGKQEIARRAKQIATGKLQVS